MIPPLSSLVRYDNPVLVSTSKDKGKGAKGTPGKKVSGNYCTSRTAKQRQLTLVHYAGSTTACGAEARANANRGHSKLYSAPKVSRAMLRKSCRDVP